MEVSQLIYGSTDCGRRRGYQLLGRSPGVPEGIVREFCRWAPSHDSLQRPSAEASSLSFFRVGDNTWTIARSIYGGPEYSGRGGMQVVTVALLFDRDQLAGYENHPIAVADTAMSLGQLILPQAIRGSLPVVSLPRVPLPSSRTDRDPAEDSILNIVRSIETGQHAYLLCDRQPIDVLNDVYWHLQNATRLSTSFTTGLKPSLHRNVQLQFILDADDITISRLKREQTRCVHSC